MKQFILLILCISITACGKNGLVGDLIQQDSPKDPRKVLTTDPAFKEYVDLFIDDYRKETGKEIYVGNIPINFRNVKGEGSNTIGLCYKYSGYSETWREIAIDREWWELADKWDKEVLIKHELGHCALNRRHDDHKVGRVKTSVMNSYILAGYYFEKYHHGYNVELYTKNKSILLDSIE